MRTKKVKCKSGRMGEQYKLRKAYANFEEFEGYCENYAIHTRLGYKTPASCWKADPTVQSSTEPSDLRKVKVPKKQSLFDRENEFRVEDHQL